MNRVIKWLLIISGGLFVFLIAIIILVPMFVDLKEYRPRIESVVSETTGRPFTMGEDLRLTLFPWASIVVNDVHLGNPPEFEEKDLLSVETFEVRIKVMPLVLSLFKDIQIKRFILKGARIVLEKRKDGVGSWEGIGKGSDEVSREPRKKVEEPPESKPIGGLPIEAIAVGEFAVTDGSLIWIDQTTGNRFQVSDMRLELQNVSLDRPIHIDFFAHVNGHPLSLEGNVGPLGKDPGKGTIPVNFSLSAVKQLDLKLNGSVLNALSNPQFDFNVEVLPFSPRKFIAALGQEFPMVTADPKALSRAAFRAHLSGDTEGVSISDGSINMDESTLNFSGKAENFSKPDVRFAVELDKIDLDRYLAPKADDKSEAGTKKEETQGRKEKTTGSVSEQQRIDYGPFRRFSLDGTVKIGKLKAINAEIQDLSLKITGKNGVFNLEPLSCSLYQGNAIVKGSLNVKGNRPISSLIFQAQGIETNPLLKDIAEKDILEGQLNAEVKLGMEGDDAVRIKKTLNGAGIFLVKNGAIKGIDLVAMVRNTDGAYGFAHKEGQRPKTEFTEFQVPFKIEDGVFITDNANIVSTLLRVQSTGKADLVGETINFRIEPTFVTTGKEDAEKMKRSEVMFPVLVTGSLTDPKFRPDLKGIAKKKLEEEVLESSKFKEIFEKEELKPFEEDAKKLLKGIFK